MFNVTFTDEEEKLLSGMPEEKRLAITAYRQAMLDLGVPPHPGGICPGDECPCNEMTEAIEARAYELLGLEQEAAR